MSTEQPHRNETHALGGDVVERQTFLNGRRAYTIAGEAGGGAHVCSWTLTLTLPRDEDEPLDEGDLSLELDGRSWEAELSGGEYHAAEEDSAEAATIRAHFRLTKTPDADCTLPWPAAEAELLIGFDRAELTLRPL